MTVARISEVLDADRGWLEPQPGMTPWDKGCDMIVRQLEEWLAQYSKSLCDLQVTTDNANHPVYIHRLWACWRYHWRKAASTAPDGRIDGREVADRIRSGRGCCGSGRLGGNPLRDVVLAEAVQHKEEKAMHALEEENRLYCIAQGIRVNSRVAKDKRDWWYRLLDELGGYSNPPGKLSKFRGKCGLRNWLGTVSRNFARGYPPWSDARESDIEPSKPEEHNGPEVEECLTLLAGLLNNALKALSPEDRTLLFMIYVDAVPQKQVAGLLGIDPGNVTKRKQKVLRKKLPEILTSLVSEFRHPEAYEDCLELLIKHCNLMDLANVIPEILQEFE